MKGYETLAHLNRSNRYDTYEVWSEERQCSCVAKRPRPDAPKRTAAALRLEGARLVELCHPHLVRGYEVIEDTLVMETLDGETVAHLIATKALETDEVAWLGLQVASALHYLHGRGLLHLDVKPGNLIATGGRAVLIDLSMARPPGRYQRGIGTWCNLAPEQARGDELTAAADVWGLGTVLLEAATGSPAFPQEEPEFPQLVHAPPPSSARSAMSSPPAWPSIPRTARPCLPSPPRCARTRPDHDPGANHAPLHPDDRRLSDRARRRLRADRRRARFKHARADPAACERDDHADVYTHAHGEPDGHARGAAQAGAAGERSGANARASPPVVDPGTDGVSAQPGRGGPDGRAAPPAHGRAPPAADRHPASAAAPDGRARAHRRAAADRAHGAPGHG